ncbi:unnamed protein product, partial [Rotaria magnacalcarata]
NVFFESVSKLIWKVNTFMKTLTINIKSLILMKTLTINIKSLILMKTLTININD